MRKIGVLPMRLIVISLVVAGFGCSKNPSLVGVWNGDIEVVGNTGKLRTEFNADGTYRTTIRMQFFKGELVAVDTGTWKLTGDKLDITMVDTDWKFSGLDAAGQKRNRERFESNKAKMIAESNAEPPATVTWKGTDAVVIKSSTAEYALQRVR